MEDRPNQLLANLAKDSTSASENPARLSFVAALETLGYQSVFDIIRGSKTAFVEQLGTLSDADGELAYENARCYATQIARYYRDALVSSGQVQPASERSGVRSLVDIGPSFPNLFKENWDTFCKVGAIEAMDSPVAYLASLYRFATTQLEGSSTDTKRILLANRRPDIKDLLIDQDSAFKAVPMLNIVNDVLDSGIKDYVGALPKEDPQSGKTPYELFAQRKRPFPLFPYNFHHQQVKLGLASKNLTLGELSHRISLKLPIYGASTDYGKVNALSENAQIMLTGFGPEQIKTITENPWPGLEKTAELDLRYQEHYGMNYYASFSLRKSGAYMSHTGLTSLDLESLVATRSQTPVPSPNALKLAGVSSAYGRKYGAAFSNQWTDTPLQLTGVGVAGTIDGANHATLDHFQRVIRLRDWMKLEWAELDTLLFATARPLPSTTRKVITNLTLRGLGVFQYLSEKYTISAEEFAGMVWEIPIFASGGRTPVFDRVFNNQKVSDKPLVLDDRPLTLPLDAQTTALIANGMKMDVSDPMLALLIGESHGVIPKLGLTFITMLYRRARSAELFGCSVTDFRSLVYKLGGNPYLNIWDYAQLNAPGTRPGPDYYDVLMQGEWLALWVKNHLNSKKDLDELIGTNFTYAGEVASPAWIVQARKEANALAAAIGLRYKGLALPPLTVEAAVANQWDALISSSLLDEKGFITAVEDIQQTIRTALAALTDAKIGGVPWASRTDLESLLRLIESTFTDARSLQSELVGKLLSVLGIPPADCQDALDYVVTPQDNFLSTLAESNAYFTSILKRIYTVVEMKKKLGISRTALLTFGSNPKWVYLSLAGPLPVTLATVYLLDSYNRWTRQSPFEEKEFLDYLQLANGSPPTASHASVCAKVLGPLLDLPLVEVTAASALLTDNIAKSMADIDWLLRVKDTCLASGLSVANLLLATSLTANSPAADWQKVGSAVVAASAR